MHIEIIRNRNLIGSIAVFTVVDTRGALALYWEWLCDLYDDGCLFPAVCVSAREPQFFLDLFSHLCLSPVGLIRLVTHGDTLETPATILYMVALTMPLLVPLHVGPLPSILKIVPVLQDLVELVVVSS